MPTHHLGHRSSAPRYVSWWALIFFGEGGEGLAAARAGPRYLRAEEPRGTLGAMEMQKERDRDMAHRRWVHLMNEINT